MELIKISDSKLKIALTPTDMEKYSLDIQTMDYDKTETRSAFWQLLDEAKHKTGFDAASEKIFRLLDLPEPERPVMTISFSLGRVRLTFFRLCSRAPLMTILSFAKVFSPFSLCL